MLLLKATINLMASKFCHYIDLETKIKNKISII